MNAAPLPVPANEDERIRQLRELGIPDTPAEPEFDRIVRLAALCLDMPMAAISLVERDRHWFKASLGLAAAEGPRHEAFCAHALEADGWFEIPDTLQSVQFAGHPEVQGGKRLRYFACVPLKPSDGCALGTLFVADRRPRLVDAAQRTMLADLAAIAVGELERRRAIARAASAEQRQRAAIEALADGFALFDRDDRLVVANSRYARSMPGAAGLVRPGVTFEALLRAGVAADAIPAARADGEAYVAAAVADRRRAEIAPFEQVLPEGRWVLVRCTRTPDGGLVELRADITAMKYQEFELRSSYNELLETYDRLNALHLQVQNQLRAAEQLQINLLPSAAELATLTSQYGLRVDSLFQPSRHLGGDHWLIWPIDEYRCGICLYDFSGHGVDAAVNVFRLHGFERGLPHPADTPSAFLGIINGFLSRSLPRGCYATALAAVFDRRRAVLTYAAAGAPDPIILSDGGALVARGSGRGVPLGLRAGSQYEDRTLPFGPGLRFAAYSDAFLEGLDPLDRERAAARFEPLLARHLADHGSPAGLLERLAGEPDWAPDDDITLVVVHRGNPPPAMPAPRE